MMSVLYGGWVRGTVRVRVWVWLFDLGGCIRAWYSLYVRVCICALVQLSLLKTLWDPKSQLTRWSPRLTSRQTHTASPHKDLHCSTSQIQNLYNLAHDAAASLPRPTPVRPVRPASPPELGVAAPGRLSAFSAARQPPIQPGRLAGQTPGSDPGLADPPASGRRLPAPASEGLRGCEAAAIEGWLAGLGLERYAELLLEAGWDSVEVTGACHISVGVRC